MLWRFFSDRKTAKKHPFSRTLQNHESRPQCCFYTRIHTILRSHLSRLGAQNDDLGVPFKNIFFQKWTLAGTRAPLDRFGGGHGRLCATPLGTPGQLLEFMVRPLSPWAPLCPSFGLSWAAFGVPLASQVSLGTLQDRFWSNS